MTVGVNTAPSEYSSVVSTVRNENPILYRGYYYDSDMGMYYLQSRYYVPSMQRFFNADDPTYAQLGKDTKNGTNLFAYCNNDPVNNSDPRGNWVLSFGAELEASIIFGGYGGIGVNIDGLGNIVFTYCAGVEFTTTFVGNIAAYVTFNKLAKNAKSVKGWSINVSAAFCKGISLSGGLNVSLNGKLSGVSTFSYGVGSTFILPAYLKISGGYTGIMYSTTFKKLFATKKGSTFKKKKKGVKISIINQKTYISIYVKSIKRYINIYPKGKLTVTKRG